MKIIIIGTTSNTLLGFRSSFIKKLVEKGCIVYALSTDFDELTKKKVRDLGGIPINYKFSRSASNPMGDIFNTIKLSFILRKLKCDVLFCYFSKPVVFGTLAGFLAKIEIRIGMLEGLGYLFTEVPNGKRPWFRFLKSMQITLYRLSFLLLNKLIVLNNDDKNDLVKSCDINRNKVEVLGGIGLELENYPYSAFIPEKLTFIFVARLLEEKGINYYLDAAVKIKKVHNDVEFIVLGGLDLDNPGSVSIDKINQLKQQGTITYPGNVDNVADWVSNSSVFVLPSYYREGVPRSTQEAMAIGRPVITTDMPGCRDTVIDGVNGFLIPPHSLNELIKCMLFFVENPGEIEKMGKESYKIAVEKFDSKIIDEKLYDLLTS